jgi:hypothetical protein
MEEMVKLVVGGTYITRSGTVVKITRRTGGGVIRNTSADVNATVPVVFHAEGFSITWSEFGAALNGAHGNQNISWHDIVKKHPIDANEGADMVLHLVSDGNREPRLLCKTWATANRLSKSIVVKPTTISEIKAVRIGTEWYVPAGYANVYFPNEEDEKEQIVLDSVKVAIDRALSLGMTAEEIELIQSPARLRT